MTYDEYCDSSLSWADIRELRADLLEQPRPRSSFPAAAPVDPAWDPEATDPGGDDPGEPPWDPEATLPSAQPPAMPGSAYAAHAAR